MRLSANKNKRERLREKRKNNRKSRHLLSNVINVSILFIEGCKKKTPKNNIFSHVFLVTSWHASHEYYDSATTNL